MKKYTLIIVMVLLAGCHFFSDTRERYVIENMVNKDIREMIKFYGPITAAYDRTDGLRVFQWNQKNLYRQPPVANVLLDAKSYENSSLYNPVSALPQRNTLIDRCAYSLASRFDEQRGGWFVERVEIPALRCIP